MAFHLFLITISFLAYFFSLYFHIYFIFSSFIYIIDVHLCISFCFPGGLDGKESA